MKQLHWILLLILLLTAGTMPSYAQQRDSDGDGLVDSIDQCPSEPGPTATFGCPQRDPNNPPGEPQRDPNNQSGDPNTGQDNGNSGQGEGTVEVTPPPSLPDTDLDTIVDVNDACPTVPGVAEKNGCPPFERPRLPAEDCYVTPFDDHRVNVRPQPSFDAEWIGQLLQGEIYPADGFVMVAGEQWFVLPAGSFPVIGYVHYSAVAASLACPELDYDEKSQDDVVVDGTIITAENPSSSSYCTVVTGYDVIFWNGEPLGGEVAAFYFGTFLFPFPSGSKVPVGTTPIAIFNLLNNPPAESYELANWTVQETDPSVLEAALNAEFGGDYGWPTPHGRMFNSQFVPFAEVRTGGDYSAIAFVGGWGTSTSDTNAASRTSIKTYFAPSDLRGSSTHPGGVNAVFADGSVRFVADTTNFAPIEVSFYRLSGELGGTCGPIGNTPIDDLTTPDAEGGNVAALDIPINEFACTIEADPFVFAYNAAPGEIILPDTAPMAILSGDSWRVNPADWIASPFQINPDAPFLPYMEHWQNGSLESAYPRTGGTCGPIVNPNVELPVPQETRAGDWILEIDGIKGETGSTAAGGGGQGRATFQDFRFATGGAKIIDVIDDLCGGEFAIIPGDPNGGGSFDVVCGAENSTQAIDWSTMDQLCEGKYMVESEPSADGGVYVAGYCISDNTAAIQLLPAIQKVREAARASNVIDDLCGGEFAVIPGDPNGGGSFDVECRPAAEVERLDVETFDELCGGEFAIIPGDPNGGSSFDVECRPDSDAELNGDVQSLVGNEPCHLAGIGFCDTPSFEEIMGLCGGEFAVIPSDPNGGSFDVECRPDGDVQTSGGSTSLGDFVVVKQLDSVAFDVIGDFCGGTFALIPSDPNGGGSFDVECRPDGDAQIGGGGRDVFLGGTGDDWNRGDSVAFETIGGLCGGEFVIIPSDPNGGSFDVECRTVGQTHSANLDQTFGQMCGGKYTVWGKNDSLGNPIYMDAACLPPVSD